MLVKGLDMVYFIQCGKGGPIKIGYSTDPWRRLDYMQVCCPYELTLIAVLPGDAAKERQIQGWYEHCRIRGEWYKPRVELVTFIAHDCNKPPPRTCQPTGAGRPKVSGAPDTFGVRILWTRTFVGNELLE